MLVNRIGDVGLALGICLIFLNYKTVDYNTVFALTPMVLDKTCYIFGTQVNILVIISLLLFLRCFRKICSNIIAYMVT